jgi:hypothetical protein
MQSDYIEHEGDKEIKDPLIKTMSSYFHRENASVELNPNDIFVDPSL